MTPTTPKKAREIASDFRSHPLSRSIEQIEAAGECIYSLLGQAEALTKERDELRLQIDIQAGSIEAVQSANQRLSANHKDCAKCLGEALQDRADLAKAAKLATSAMKAGVQ